MATDNTQRALDALSPLLDAGWAIRLYRNGTVYTMRALDGASTVIGRGSTVSEAWIDFMARMYEAQQADARC